MCKPQFLSLVVRVVLVATLGANIVLAQLGGYAGSQPAAVPPAVAPAAATTPATPPAEQQAEEEKGLNDTQGKEVKVLLRGLGFAKSADVDVKIESAMRDHLQKFHPQPKGWWEELKQEAKLYWPTLGAIMVLGLLLFLGLRKKNSHATKLIPLILTLSVASSMQAQVCWNVETGKTPGAQKAAIGVLTVTNTFGCSVAGKVVELVDDKGAVLLTPVVKNQNPLSFEFTPAVPGRAIIRIDGKTYGQVVIRPMAEAILLNDAVDLVGGTRGAGAVGGDSDAKARLVLEGIIMYACKGDKNCATKIKADAWGPGKGSSAKAGSELAALLEARTLEAASPAVMAALAAFEKKLPQLPEGLVSKVEALETDQRNLAGVVNGHTERLNTFSNKMDEVTTVQTVVNNRLTAAEAAQVEDRATIGAVGAAVVTGSGANRCAAYNRLKSQGIISSASRAPKGCAVEKK